MKVAAIFLLSLAVAAQTTEPKELKFRFDPEARVRPGETVVIQIQVWGDAIAKDGTRTTGRLRDAATAKVAAGQGAISKPFRFQGTDNGGFVSTGGGGFAEIFQSVSGQFLAKDAVLYTAPMQPGTYTVEAEIKSIKGSTQITVASDAPSRKAAEKQEFPKAADNNRYRQLAEYWAPYLAQETWWQPKSDVPTRFDFDGDWNGENNWDNMEAGSSQAYVHYAAVETNTHWFLHYNFFHPRDYSDNCIAGTCHENDNEGIILTIRKQGGEFGTLELMETLAHNNVYTYTNETRLRNGTHTIDGKLEFYDGHHPIVFIEAGGHGALGSAASESTFVVSKMEFKEGTGITLLYKGAAERPQHGNDRNIGYDLISIEDEWWPRAKKSGERTFDAEYVYQPFGNRPGGGQKYVGSFWGRKHGANKAKPFWGWHDERTRRGKVLNTGQWALDPAYSVTRNVNWPAALPVEQEYLYNPYLGIGQAPPPMVSGNPSSPLPPKGNVVAYGNGENTNAPSTLAPATPPAAAAEGTCQLEAVIDGSMIISLRGETAAYEVLSGQAEKETSLGCSGGPIPDRPLAEFDLRKTKGRGSVKILERPNSANSFTAKVQVDDPSRGADRYVLVVRWKM